MCSDGVSQLVMTDQVINEKISSAGLDFLHLQVLVNLYSLKLADDLDRVQELLPVYLSKSREECDILLDQLESADLVRKSGATLELVEEIGAPEQDHSCACSV